MKAIELQEYIGLPMYESININPSFQGYCKADMVNTKIGDVTRIYNIQDSTDEDGKLIRNVQLEVIKII